MERKENEIIYHYCSLESFLEIIRNNTLRFSDITKSNDGEEVVFISKLFNNYLESKKLKNGSYNYFSKDFLKENRYFVLSLSTNCDSSAEWLIYGQNGISIGFNKEKFKSYIESLKILDRNPKLDYVKYVSFNDLKDLKPKFDDLIQKNNGFSAAVDTSNIAPIYKNKCWEHENEVRAYFLSSIQPDFTFHIVPEINNSKESSKQKDYVRENKIIHYYDVYFPLNLIKEIWIGPKAKVSISEIIGLLIKYDKEHKISNIEYPDINESKMLLEDK